MGKHEHLAHVREQERQMVQMHVSALMRVLMCRFTVRRRERS